MRTIAVTQADIDTGETGCFNCPVAIALQRALGDTEANVYERDWEIHLNVHSRHILAPHDVAVFVHDFDGRGSRFDERPKPFEFDLPGFDDPEWKERCQHCEQLFDAAKLDDEGVCKECLAK